MPTKIRILNVSFYRKNVRARLPFRFGAFTMEEVSLLHLAIEAESENGSRIKGFAADNLMPKWFDKDPTKSLPDNVDDLLSSVRIARDRYAESGRTFESVWEIWREAYPACLRQGEKRGLNSLVSSFGSALFERALLDAVGKISGRNLIGILRENLAGIRPEEIHEELDYATILQWAFQEPSSTLTVRHTVGLLDSLDASDPIEENAPADGLPRTLEEYILRHGLRFFKVKIGGFPEADVDRLRRVAGILDHLIPEPYGVTLDGNEQYKSISEFHQLIEKIKEVPALRRFYRSIVFVEQPLDRGISLDPGLREGLREVSSLCPVVIDESDDHLNSFKIAVALGYRGVSTKNCKGVMKSFLNRSLIARLNSGRPQREKLFMSAEDLTNLPIVPLQEDLATVRALGISHVERNGYHYVNGLDHCSPRERELAVRYHGDLYEGDSEKAFMRVEKGCIRIDSLSVPGYGVAFDPDFASMEEIS